MNLIPARDPQSSDIRRPRPEAWASDQEDTNAQADFRHYAGNQAIQSLFRSGHIQASLAVGSIDDPAEDEAEFIAARVYAEESHERDGSEPVGIQRSPSASPSAGYVPGIVEQVLHSAGQPLDLATRRSFESRFGRNFSHVRIHDGPQAAASARSINALAYTAGSDIVFGAGQFSPGTSFGNRLIAHELAHVVQQERGLPRNDRSLSDNWGAGEAAASKIELTTASRSNVIQRQTGTQAPSWKTSLISAGLSGSGCFCQADSNGNYEGGLTNQSPTRQADPCQSFCPVICTHAPVPASPKYYVDLDLVPRPQPFDPGRLSAIVKFVPATGGSVSILLQSSGTGAYVKPGFPLQPSFNTNLSFFQPPQPGTLIVSLTNSDPTSGSVAVYSEAIPVVDCPQPGQPGILVPGSAVELGIYLHVPDPDNAPLVYQRADPNTPWSTGATVSVFKDASGYFYPYTGKRIYLPGHP